VSLVIGIVAVGGIVTGVGVHASAQAAQATVAQAQSAQLDSLTTALANAQQAAEDKQPALVASALDDAQAAMVEAAAARPENIDTLSALARQVTSYADALREATTTDALATSSTTLNTLELAITSFQSADASQATAADAIRAWWLLPAILGWVLAAGIVVAGIALARATHRLINRGLGVAFAYAVATAWWASALAATVASPDLLFGVSWGPGVMSVVAAVAAALGLRQRIREYR